MTTSVTHQHTMRGRRRTPDPSRGRPVESRYCRRLCDRGCVVRRARTVPEPRRCGPPASPRSEDEHIDALVAIGGEDTLGVAARLADESGVAVVGVPKTIDNDLAATDSPSGSRPRCRSPPTPSTGCTPPREPRPGDGGESWGGTRVGSPSTRGWPAAPTWCSCPRCRSTSTRCALVRAPPPARHDFSIVVVAEGATPREGTLTLQSGEEDAFGHVRLGGISNVVQEEIERRTGFETRVTILATCCAWHPHRVRPDPRDPLRHRRHRRGPRRRVRHDGRAARRNASNGCRSATRCASSRRSTPSSSRWPRAPLLRMILSAVCVSCVPHRRQSHGALARLPRVS